MGLSKGEFGSVERLRQVDAEQIAGVKGVSLKLVQALKSHLEADSGPVGEENLP